MNERSHDVGAESLDAKVAASDREIDPHLTEKANQEPIEGLLERLAEKEPQFATAITRYIVSQKVHHGPMPSPEDIRAYSMVQADFPERMMVMAENAQKSKARHADKLLELKEREIKLNETQLSTMGKAQQRDAFNQTLSLLLAFAVVLACIGSSVFLAINGKDILAGVIGGGTVVGIVAAFLKSKNKSESSQEGT